LEYGIECISGLVLFVGYSIAFLVNKDTKKGGKMYRLFRLLVSILAVALILALSLLVSCSSNNQGTSLPYYPHGDQSRWTYKTTYSLKDEIYYLQYIFNGAATHDQGFTVQVLELWVQDVGLVGTQYIVADSSKVDVYESTSDTNPMHLLKFPLMIGNTWRVFDDGDDIQKSLVATVVTTENVVVPAGQFNGCYKVSIISEIDPSYYSYYWYDSTVGKVKAYTVNLAEGTSLFELNSYQINP
jgi:hypothetical protein